MFIWFSCWILFMIIEYHLIKLPLHLMKYIWTHHSLWFLWVHFLEACVVLNTGKFEFNLFFTFFPISYFGGRDTYKSLINNTTTKNVCDIMNQLKVNRLKANRIQQSLWIFFWIAINFCGTDYCEKFSKVNHELDGLDVLLEWSCLVHILLHG